MVAYSFKPRFVDPIRLGLNLEPVHHGGILTPITFQPKRQTIRAHGKRRHARIGEELQLYCGQRTRDCFLIGRARCVGVSKIIIYDLDDEDGLLILLSGKTLGPRKLHEFARADGFADAHDMRAFWKVEHGDFVKFDGVIIKWEPLT